MRSFFAIMATIVLSLSPTATISQNQFTFATLTELEWLAGTWQRETRRGVMYESWQKVSDKTMEGQSYTTKEGSARYLEFLRIEVYGSEIFYIARVSHNKYPIPFKLIESGSAFVFENSDHDFPQRIIYKNTGNNTMHARIEGVMDGEVRVMEFNFLRSDSE